MSTISETGHAKNVVKFDELILSIQNFGTIYNPSKENMKVPALQVLSLNAKNAINAVSIAHANYGSAVSARELAFKPLSGLATRVMNAVIATDSALRVDDHVRSLEFKIHGTRITAKMKQEEKDALAAEGKVVKEISTSQMSYDSRVENFDKLIKVLATISVYNPNENELKIASLTSLCTTLRAKNMAVINALIILKNARVVRNDVLSKPFTGLVDIALDTKAYVKSLFSITSPQYKLISKISFKPVLV